MLHQSLLLASCALSPVNHALVERTFSAWSEVSQQMLKLDAAKPPEIILADSTCVYRLKPARSGPFSINGIRMNVTSAEHHGSVTLPTGATMNVEGMAFTSLGKDGSTFFFASLPEVWRGDPRFRDDKEDWEVFLTSVMIHELTHTRQLAAIVKGLGPIINAAGLREFDDDMVQRRYASDSAFTDGVKREVDLLFSAAAATSEKERHSLIREALSARASRHAKYFIGKDSVFATIESAFIDMEGVAQWAAASYVRKHPLPGETSDHALDRIRNNRKWWSQEYGLALYLALDASINDWQLQVFPPNSRSAFDLLDSLSKSHTHNTTH